MTNEEAIKILKHNKPTTDTRQCGVELCEACDMAIKALSSTHLCTTCANNTYGGCETQNLIMCKEYKSKR